jgi:hypothetical protein
MKPKHILAFLSIFLVTLAGIQTLIEISWKDLTITSYLGAFWKHTVSLFFSLLVAIPITVLIQKKYENNGK